MDGAVSGRDPSRARTVAPSRVAAAGVGAARVDVVAGAAAVLPSVPARPGVPGPLEGLRGSQGPAGSAGARRDDVPPRPRNRTPVEPVDVPLVALARRLADDAERLADGRRRVAALRVGERAAGRPWPPPIPIPSGSAPRPRTVPPVPLVMANGLRAVPVGCAGGEGIVCVPVVDGRWLCRRCGVPTIVPTPVIGPRVAGCTCVADIVCAHPAVPRRPPPPARTEGVR